MFFSETFLCKFDVWSGWLYFFHCDSNMFSIFSCWSGKQSLACSSAGDNVKYKQEKLKIQIDVCCARQKTSPPRLISNSKCFLWRSRFVKYLWQWNAPQMKFSFRKKGKRNVNFKIISLWCKIHDVKFTKCFRNVYHLTHFSIYKLGWKLLSKFISIKEFAEWVTN